MIFAFLQLVLNDKLRISEANADSEKKVTVKGEAAYKKDK
jgi:hypothetical protein